MYRGRVFGLVGTRFAVLALLSLLIIGQASAQVPPSLMTATNYNVSVEELPAGTDFIERGPTGAPCVSFNFRTMVRQQLLVLPFIVPAENYDSQCATPTLFGYMDGKYLYQLGETLSGEVHPNLDLRALPNSNAILAGVSSFNSHQIRVWNNYSPFDSKVSQQYGRIWYDLPGVSGADNFITDKSGQRLQFLYNTVRSSQNGEWIIAYRPNQSMARVNVASREVLPFGDVRGSTSLAVSNSGRYAAAYYTNDRSLMLFDLASCEAVPDRIIRGVACQSKNLAGKLGLNGQLENIRYLRFGSEDSLYLELEYKDQGGQLVRAHADLAPEGVDVGGVDYIAMGDSFASGEGELDASWYEPGTDVEANKCHLSRRSYPYLMTTQLGLSESHSVACSGSTTRHILAEAKHDESIPTSTLGDWHPGREAQITHAIRDIAKIFSVSIGGNNVNFAGKLKSCVITPGTCEYAVEDRVDVAREIAAVHEDLVEVYKQLAEKTEGRSKIYALGYPQFIQAAGGSCGVNVGLLNEEERVFINQAVTYLNQVIRSAADEAGVYYLDLENSLNGRNLCSGAPQSTMAFNGITAGDDNLGILANETYHPNHLAHELFKSTILAQTGADPISWQVCISGANICPRGDGLIPLPDITYWGAEAQSYVGLMNDEQSLIAELPPKHQPIVVNGQPYYQPGQELTVISGGFAPGTEVEIILRSEPVMLTKVTADSNGFIDQVVDIPEGIELGFHTLHLLGLNSVNQKVDFYESVPVFEPPTESPAGEPVAANNSSVSNESGSDSADTETQDIEEDEGTLSFSAVDQSIDNQAAETEVLGNFDEPDQTPNVVRNSPEGNSVPAWIGLLVLVVLSTTIIWMKAGSRRF